MTPTAHQFGRVHEAIRAADRVLLIAHQKPDGDTLGASSSVLGWLLRGGKDVTAFCLDTPPQTLRFLDHMHRYTTDETVFDDAYDLVIIFDSGDLRICGVDHLLPRLPEGYLLVNIDHHVANERFGHINIVLPDASSTAEIMYRFYEALDVSVDPSMATALLTGLIFDTTNFTNAATNPTTVDVAGKLLAAGARNSDITKFMLHDKTVDSLRIWGIVLSRLRYNPRYDITSTYLLQKDMEHVSNSSIEGVSNWLNAVAGETDTVLFLRELPGDQIKGSFRSVNRDISKVARLMGGGGHKKAPGFTVSGRIEETPEGPRVVI